jgi:hypothetical protein
MALMVQAVAVLMSLVQAQVAVLLQQQVAQV